MNTHYYTSGPFTLDSIRGDYEMGYTDAHEMLEQQLMLLALERTERALQAPSPEPTDRPEPLKADGSNF